MSQNYQQVNRASGVTVALVLGAAVGMAFTGYILKAPVAAKAPAPAVVTIDSAAITAAVKAAFPAPVPIATAAPVRKAAPVAAPVKRKAKRKATAAPASVIIFRAVPVCGCTS